MEKHGGEASLIYQFSRQKSLKKNNNIKVNIPELSYQLGLVDNSIQIQHLGLEFFTRQREGVGHQPLGCKRVEVEESQEIRNSAGGRTFQQHSAMYPAPQASASPVRPQQMISRKKTEGLFHSGVGLPWMTGIARRYFNVSLCITSIMTHPNS